MKGIRDQIMWRDEEKPPVDEAWDPLQAWADYKAMFPNSKRSFESVRRRWNRVHPKIMGAA